MLPTVIALLSDAEPETATEFFVTDPNLRIAWSHARDAILIAWIGTRPGTRPRYWWGCGDAPELRRRLGGTGTPCHEVLNYEPSYSFGIPDQWVGQWAADYFNGRARDVHGNPMGAYKEGDFSGLAIDPADPPQYESQATYLQRLDLLLPGELARLGPIDFRPEVVEAAEADDD